MEHPAITYAECHTCATGSEEDAEYFAHWLRREYPDADVEVRHLYWGTREERFAVYVNDVCVESVQEALALTTEDKGV